jgi:hypothetical protein
MTRRLTPAERLAATRRDATLADLAKAPAWDHHLVEQAVFLHGLTHSTWTCNDIRPLLPDAGRTYLSRAINSLKLGGIIERVPVDGRPSTSVATHGHRIAVWMLTPRGHRVAGQRFHNLEAAA